MTPGTNEGCRILVVDDDPGGRELALQILGEDAHQVEFATGGEEAWRLLESNEARPDVIVLDLVLPGMDGIELLRRIKDESHLATIPVVVASAKSDRDVIVRGIEAGAYYFVPKPLDSGMLRSIVRTAATDHARYQALQETLRKGIDAIGTLEQGIFRFRTISRAGSLATLLSQACPEPERTVVGLGELLVNAVEHGNLGITYEEKSALLASGTWQAEVDRRLALPENQEKRVEVTLERDARELRFTISDHGPGFDWRRYLTVSPERLLDTHGRGIAMANLMSFQRLDYRDPGNRVTAVVGLAPAGEVD